jgi:hypothetical protein
VQKVKFLDALHKIDEKIADPRDLLGLAVFSNRRSSEFESYIQIFSAAFQARRTSEKDARALEKFIESIINSKTTKLERVDLFLLASGLLKLFPHWKPKTDSSIKKRIVNNNGCLEFDPRAVIDSRLNVSTTSTTIVGFEPNFHSSYFLPSQIIGRVEKEQFQERIRLLYTELAGLNTNLKSLASDIATLKRFEDFIFELYENIIDHAKDKDRFPLGGSFPTEATFWFVRFERVTYNKGKLSQSLPELTIYEKFATELKLRKGKEPKFFVSVSVFDNGPGIANHYQTNLSGHDEIRDFYFFERLILEQRTSKATAGSGWGIKRALDSIADLDGFVTIRSNEFWAAKLPNQEDMINMQKEVGNVGHTLGTLYSIILPVW